MSDPKLKLATLGAGCFWGVEALFKRLPGVKETTVGYSGGKSDSPTYQQVCTGTTGHAEVVQLQYDPNEIDYKEILRTFFRLHDPTTLNRQGVDVGTQYRSAIFYHDDEQKKIAQDAIAKLNDAKIFGLPVVTQIEPAATFYRAEEYHQDYFTKNPGRVCHVLRDLGELPF